MNFNRNKKLSYKNIKKIKIIAILMILMLLTVSSLYYVNKRILPAVLEISNAEVKSEITEIINKNVGEVYSKKFNYDEIINIEKDSDGNIILLQADTVKLNNIATEMVLKTQEDIKKIGDLGIKIPIAYVFNNSLLSYWSPKISVKILPIGRIETKYNTDFQSAGINQTRHKIYIEIYSKIRVTVPLASKDIEIKVEIPVSETIIIGKIPKTSLSFDGINNK